MKASTTLLRAGIIFASIFIIVSCQKELDNIQPGEIANAGGKPVGGESVGSNLSFPVIWAENEKLTLRDPSSYPDNLLLGGDWWYVWGEDPLDPDYPIFSCEPNPANESACLIGTLPSAGYYKAYLQKDANNIWQAYNAAATAPVNIDRLDWGDNLESVDWALNSKVRTEVVLYEDMTSPVLHYAMRHVSGWGTDEMHGLQTDMDNVPVYGPGTEATVYTKFARLTIQKLNTETPNITWNPTLHEWQGGTDVNDPVFNKAVWEALDGPGYYNAEVNIKGKVIFGYTWDVKKINDGAGVYRITFSFDASKTGGPALNTFFTPSTQIIVPIEEEEVIAEAEGGGAQAMFAQGPDGRYLTYIDVTILARGTGGAKGGGSGSGGGGGTGGGGSGPGGPGGGR
jgi:hypothetical protein